MRRVLGGLVARKKRNPNSHLRCTRGSCTSCQPGSLLRNDFFRASAGYFPLSWLSSEIDRILHFAALEGFS